MKLLHTIPTDLPEKEFDILSHSIQDAIMDIDPDISDIYSVHIDIISGEWHIEFVPKSNRTPVIKVDAYTVYDDNNNEILKISPTDAIKFAEKQHFNDYNDAVQFVSELHIILDFLLELYEFEYKL